MSNNQAYSLEYKGVIDIPLLIAPGELEGITPGKHVLYLIKKQMNTLKVENMDITSSIEFYSKTIEIPISK